MRRPQIFRNAAALFFEALAAAIQNIFWTTIAACMYPGLSGLYYYVAINIKWPAFKQWCSNTWVAKKLAQFGRWFNAYITTPLLMPVWKHVISPIVNFGKTYKATLTVMLLITTILTSITLPPAAFIGIPIVAGIIAAYFERKHNNAQKALAAAQAKELEKLKADTGSQDTTIKALQTELAEIKVLMKPLLAQTMPPLPQRETELDDRAQNTSHYALKP